MSQSNGAARDGQSVLILTFDHKSGTLQITGQIANKGLRIAMLAMADMEMRAQIADARNGGRVAVAPGGTLAILDKMREG